MAATSKEITELVQRGYRFALSLTHNAAQAEDLVQDAWFAVLRARGPWNPQYLFTTVRNRFIDLYRRDRAVGFEALDHHPEPEGADESRLWDDQPGSVTLNGSLDAALGRLRPEERAVLYLSAVEGFTAKQIAEMLDWPRGTVLSMLHRSKNKIRGNESLGSESRP